MSTRCSAQWRLAVSESAVDIDPAGLIIALSTLVSALTGMLIAIAGLRSGQKKGASEESGDPQAHGNTSGAR